MTTGVSIFLNPDLGRKWIGFFFKDVFVFGFSYCGINYYSSKLRDIKAMFRSVYELWFYWGGELDFSANGFDYIEIFGK